MDELLKYIPQETLPAFEQYLKAMLGDVHRKIAKEYELRRTTAEWERRHIAIKLSARRGLAKVIGGMSIDQAAAEAAREVPFPPAEVAAYWIKILQRQRQARLRSKRSDRIFAMMRDGKSNAEIARKLGCSYSTVAKTLTRKETQQCIGS